MRLLWRAWLPLLLIRGHSIVTAADGDVVNDFHVLLLQTRLKIQASTEKVEDNRSRQDHVVLRRQLGDRMLRHEGVFDDAVEEYARLYHDLLPQSSMLFFLHVSKSAGTFICNMGQQNGCRFEGDRVCHLDFDGGSKWSKLSEVQSFRKWPNTCADLSTIFAVHNLTLELNENYLIQDGLCPEFWNVMIFRDPLHRLMSHLSMMNSTDWMNAPWSSPENLTSANIVFDNIPQLSNNYFIRTLLGASVYNLPFGSITSDHLEEAKRVLEGFDVLLIVDEDSSAMLDTDIRLTLGFDDAEVIDSPRQRRLGTTDIYSQSLRWTSTDWDLLDVANALDSELWKHAKALHSADQQVFKHPAFSKVSATMSRAPCGYLSK